MENQTNSNSSASDMSSFLLPNGEIKYSKVGEEYMRALLASVTPAERSTAVTLKFPVVSPAEATLINASLKGFLDYCSRGAPSDALVVARVLGLEIETVECDEMHVRFCGISEDLLGEPIEIPARPPTNEEVASFHCFAGLLIRMGEFSEEYSETQDRAIVRGRENGQNTAILRRVSAAIAKREAAAAAAEKEAKS